jgi:outer membrane cobalamin receptor
MKNVLFTIILSFIVYSLFADSPDKKGVIKGVIRDSITRQPVEFATVAVYKSNDQTLIDGAITGETGDFKITKLENGNYDLEITFIGYKTKRLKNVYINGNNTLELNDVFISMTAENLKEVEITAGVPSIEYQIDKKVIHVDKQIAATAGTAVDILETVPSVSVDVEGNVTLRGSSGFSVFIDGKPSILEPNEVLQQIPASAIADIEIITNPSAKYDPDGTAGIINIIMKKIKLEGFNGIVDANVGRYGTFGGDFLLNYRKNAVNIYLGADYNKRVDPGMTEYERITIDTAARDTTTTVAKGDFESIRLSWQVRGGIEIDAGDNDYFNIGIRYGHRERTGTTTRNYDEWVTPGDFHHPYISNETSERGGDFYSATLDYRHTFKKQGHNLSAQFIYDHRDSREMNTNELQQMTYTIQSAQKSTEEGPAERFRIKADYTLPIGENDKFEAGYQSRLSKSEDANNLYNYDVDTDEFVLIPEYSNTTSYDHNIHAVYAMYAGEVKSFGYQLGLRGEYTYRFMELIKTGETYTLDRMDYFPTVHLSYNFPKDHMLMTSYTRRIDRPRGWYLEPFITVQDAYNLSQGNPELLPEYIDSYELNYQKRFNRDFISFETYYRVTHNKIERVSSVYEENILLHTYENVGKDYSLGGELMIGVDIFKWWHADIMGNLYYYQIKGEIYNESFDNTSLNWGSRFNNSFKVAEFTHIQLTGNYVSPSVSAQGKRYGYYMVNAAVKQEFFKRKLSLTLSARDLFGTAVFESIDEGPYFSNYFYAKRNAPMVSLSVSFKINNYKIKRNPTSEGFDTDEEF